MFLVNTGMMQELTISEELHNQLQIEADDGDLEATMWKMVAIYRRAHNPEVDSG
jgi:hypothetical protein